MNNIWRNLALDYTYYFSNKVCNMHFIFLQTPEQNQLDILHFFSCCLDQFPSQSGPRTTTHHISRIFFDYLFLATYLHNKHLYHLSSKALQNSLKLGPLTRSQTYSCTLTLIHKYSAVIALANTQKFISTVPRENRGRVSAPGYRK